jgi:hypothetical protein
MPSVYSSPSSSNTTTTYCDFLSFRYELPPLRTFGRKRTHISAKGLGAVNTKGKFQSIPADNYTENHVTNVFTHKLSFYGYDKRTSEKRVKWKNLLFKEGKNNNTIDR